MDNILNPHIPFDYITIEKTKSQLATDMAQSQVHPFFELYFLLWGERRYFIGSNIYNVAPGNLVIIPPNEIHKTGALNKKGYDRYVVYFTEESVEELKRLIGTEAFENFARMGCAQFQPEHARLMRDIMDKLSSEESRNDNLSKATKQGLIYDIVVTTLRHGTKKQCATHDGADKIQLVAKHISENYPSEITLESAAQLACMEKTYFSKRFKALTGFGFSAYLTNTRIIAAKNLLASTDLNISEISDACGFSGSNYFGDAFLRATGLSPSAWRKTNNKMQ